MSFSDELKSARRAAGLTQQQVADAMGLTNSTYCGYETGKRQPDVKKIKQLSAVLKVSADKLLETGFDIEAADPTTTNIQKVTTSMKTMNEEGQERVVDYADDLVQSGKYIKTRPAELGKKQA